MRSHSETNRRISIGNKCSSRKVKIEVESDARDVYDWLTDPNGGGLPVENVTLLIGDKVAQSEEASTRPTREDADEAFERLVQRAQQGKERVGRRLYIYLAGHGYGFGLDEVALLMANASREGLGRSIGAKTYADYFRASGAFDEVVLFVDCDRSEQSSATPSQPPWIKRMSPHPAIFFYALAAERGGHAYEGADSSGKISGFFTS